MRRNAETLAARIELTLWAVKDGALASEAVVPKPLSMATTDEDEMVKEGRKRLEGEAAEEASSDDDLPQLVALDEQMRTITANGPEATFGGRLSPSRLPCFESLATGRLPCFEAFT